MEQTTFVGWPRPLRGIKPGTIEATVALTTCGFDYGPSNEDVARIMDGLGEIIWPPGKGWAGIGDGGTGPHIEGHRDIGGTNEG